MTKEVKTSYFFETKDYKEFKKWVIDNDMNMRDVAEKMGVSEAYLSAIIRGKRNITPKVVELFRKVGYELCQMN